jgi:translocation and assembly module TamA
MKRFLFLMAPFYAMAIPYEINFVGISDKDVLKRMFDVSDLVVLQERPPASINGLRYRMNSDIPALMKVLHAYGYYDASISTELDVQRETAQVYILVFPGEQYRLASYEVFHGDCTELIGEPNPTCIPFTASNLGLKLNQPAISIDIINAELEVLTQLARCGHPLANVSKRRVIVDMAEKVVNAATCVDEGPESKFGPVTYFGLKKVDPKYVTRRIAWHEGDLYNTDRLDDTQKKLLSSNLFSSVYITHGDQLDAMGELPMKVRITEATFQQINAGVYYATVDGIGGTVSWNHRNVDGNGAIVSINADASFGWLYNNVKYGWIGGNFTYKKPDFLIFDQTYRALAEATRENIPAYHDIIYRGANYIEQKNKAIGLKLEHINVFHSASNGEYLLVGLPIFLKYDTTDSEMDPTRGYKIVYQVTPYQSCFHANQHFVKQRLTSTFFIPMGSKNFVFAGRVQFGSIAGTRHHHIPMPKLFLGGSEDELRGYRFKTVSPLNRHRKPLGGRSAIYATVETRIKIDPIGIVPFVDFGTVTLNELPQVDAKWFKSVGLGLRYYSFFGPLRVDIGFPLNRRHGIDHAFELYASVGQTF